MKSIYIVLFALLTSLPLGALAQSAGDRVSYSCQYQVATNTGEGEEEGPITRLPRAYRMYDVTMVRAGAVTFVITPASADELSIEGHEPSPGRLGYLYLAARVSIHAPVALHVVRNGEILGTLSCTP